MESQVTSAGKRIGPGKDGKAGSEVRLCTRQESEPGDGAWERDPGEEARGTSKHMGTAAGCPGTEQLPGGTWV